MHLLATLFATALFAAAALGHEEPPSLRGPPTGFIGMRGKRAAADDGQAAGTMPEEQGSLRGPPRGFIGTRGKRAAANDGRQAAEATDDYAAAAEKRAPSGFTGGYPEALYKRAPYGFVGMRGKKEDELAGDDEKRAYGFMGMRGKKETRYPYFRMSNYYSDKRAPMGFMGMRGKKSYDEALYSDDKRAPQGFFGMRGKKLGFVGMRGKKLRPYEFRGKFVGVRGKKSSYEVNGPDYYTDLDLERLVQELDMNQLMLLLSEQNEADNRKWNEYSDGLTRQ